jgi:hypothetical protein
MKEPTKRWVYLWLLILCSTPMLMAQQFMQLERYGKPRAQRIYPGEVIQYRYEGDWYEGEIKDFRHDLNWVVLHNRFIPLEEISALRYPRNWPRPIGRQLQLFGISWSGWALIGSATDPTPGIDYRWSDLAVSTTALASGLALPHLVGKFKVVPLGKRRKLRLMDLRM